MAVYDDLVVELRGALQEHGYDLAPTAAKTTDGGYAAARVKFPQPIFPTTLFGIGDVHLGSGDGGDIFRFTDAFPNDEKPKKLFSTLQALKRFRDKGNTCGILQFGDWFDVWRSELGGKVVDIREPDDMGYSHIERCYPDILQLDAELGIDHLVGNHDASFLRALPSTRVRHADYFHLGQWVDGDRRRIFSLHGHQTQDILPPANSEADLRAVAIGTLLAKALPEAAVVQAYIDRLGTDAGVKKWLTDRLLTLHPDDRLDVGPPPLARRPAPPSRADGPLLGQFVARGGTESLVDVALKVGRAAAGTAAPPLDMVLVGHSHVPCIDYGLSGGHPVVLLDVGAWVYRQSNLVVAAWDTAAVWDVVP